MPHMEWVWLASVIIFAMLEASTNALVSLWFIGGGLAALLGANIWVQTLLFFGVSAVLLMLLRPIARRYLTPKPEVMNAQSNVGKSAIVTETIDNLHGSGTVKISGVEWSARSADDQPIETGAVVTIKAIQGAKVCVERAQ